MVFVLLPCLKTKLDHLVSVEDVPKASSRCEAEIYQGIPVPFPMIALVHHCTSPRFAICPRDRCFSVEILTPAGFLSISLGPSSED